jgi:hypothetical protein
MFVRFEALMTRSVMIIVLLSMKLFSLVGNAGMLRLDFVILGDLHYYYFLNYYYYYYYYYYY